MGIKLQIGKRIKEIRKAKKLTQEKLAELVGLETPSISNIENGKYFPSAENLDKIMSVLEITPSELFMCDEHKTNEELIAEMLTEMKTNKNLTKLMYKFYLLMKY